MVAQVETGRRAVAIKTEDGVMDELARVFAKQRAHRWYVSRTGAIERIAKLKKIREAIFARRIDLHQAILNDYGKNPAETDLTELYPTITEINHTIRHLKKWMRPRRVSTPLTLLGTHSEVRHEAKGVVLILSPWNYPFQLLMSPLVAAISAGNCAMLKPSSKVPHTCRFLKNFISELFPEEEVALFEGSALMADRLLELPFDHVFFTGSPRVGRHVMELAAKHLAPVTLELGGKSPVIVDGTADIKKAAERIMWGKFINAGQTCVAPDYLLIHESRRDGFIAAAKKILAERYGSTPELQAVCPDYCRLVSEEHLNGLKKLLGETVRQGARIECGGTTGPDARYLAPTLLTHVRDDSAIMQEEIFGPILPIITFKTVEEAIAIIRKREKPLALYVFSRDERFIEDVLGKTTAGGTCVNTLLIHLANQYLPFGGVGQSGMGNYHGYYGFCAFSHERAVLRQGCLDTLKNFYPPYTDALKKMILFTMKHFG